MAAPFTKLNTPLDRLEYVCRGCLTESGEMKNIYEWELSDDYFKLTNLLYKKVNGMSELLCTTCETTLKTCTKFRQQCIKSERYLQNKLRKSRPKTTKIKNELTSILHEQKLVIMITAPREEEKIPLPCPYHCTETFAKKNDVYGHLKKVHSISDNFEIDIKFYCHEITCPYHMSSAENKSFSGRKFLNQHVKKMHKERMYWCPTCSHRFPTESDFDRHSKSCGMVYVCELCDSEHKSNETLMVHLMRKHPKVHKTYKDSKKRPSTNENVAKKTKIEEVTNATEVLAKENGNTIVNTTELPAKINGTKIVDSSKLVKDDGIEIMNATELLAKDENIEIINAAELLAKDDGIEVMNSPQILAKNNGIEMVNATDILAKDNDNAIENRGMIDTIDQSWQVKEGSKIESPKNLKPLPFCDSPKRSFGAQIPEDINIKNDVSLPSWARNDFEIKTDEISTQTVFEDLLSLKSQNSEDDIYFSEAVSLSDIQTQTFPLEFDLMRSDKETQSINSQTESPDLSIKETQTCFCHFESPRPNFRLFDSLSSSPASVNLTSAETQTGDHKFPVKSDVLLSFNSAETQTCFDESSNDSM